MPKRPPICQSPALRATRLSPGKCSLLPVAKSPDFRQQSNCRESAGGEPGLWAAAPDAIVLRPGKECIFLLGARSLAIILAHAKYSTKTVTFHGTHPCHGVTAPPRFFSTTRCRNRQPTQLPLARCICPSLSTSRMSKTVSPCDRKRPSLLFIPP